MPSHLLKTGVWICYGIGCYQLITQIESQLHGYIENNINEDDIVPY